MNIDEGFRGIDSASLVTRASCELQVDMHAHPPWEYTMELASLPNKKLKL